ncbi:MAG: hypothetical protein QXG86_00955 [Candidatus Woesearchaeota archaeon]
MEQNSDGKKNNVVAGYIKEMRAILPAALKNILRDKNIPIDKIVESYAKIINEASDDNYESALFCYECLDLITSWYYLKNKFNWRNFSKLDKYKRRELLEKELDKNIGTSNEAKSIIYLKKTLEEKLKKINQA